MSEARPVTHPAAFTFLIARIDETDEHDVEKKRQRELTRVMWIAQDRTDSSGAIQRRIVRSVLEKHQEHPDFDPAWLA